ncbi:MAG: NAD-dependent epimerase/dehydratase family protein [Xanthomonadales bacterium]|nr:NAD-dependent epimerase/dehydratase family protein [Xanthomonadales bacterium]
MKVLVTGGGGFLGSAICRQLLARGDQVIAYQRSPADELENLGARVVQGDITDAGLLNAASKGVDAIIHTAAKAGLSVNYDDYFGPNVTGTENVLGACHTNGIRKLVFTSSPSVTHSDGDIEGGTESLPYAETYNSPYPETKALSEQQVMAANSPELHTVSLRPHLIWGPGDSHLLPKLLERARHGKLKLPGPDKLIDTVYIDNAARAHLLALDKLETNPEIVGGKVYFISNDEPLSQSDIIGGLLKAAGVEVDIQAISPRLAIAAGTVLETGWKLFGIKSDPPLTRWSAEHLSTAHWYDISAAKRDLGYTAEISIAEGLDRLAQEYRRKASAENPTGS